MRSPQEERGRAGTDAQLRSGRGRRSAHPERLGGFAPGDPALAQREEPEQLAFDLLEPVTASLPELPGYTALEETEAELGITGIDARRHVMELYEPVIARLGCTKFVEARTKRNDSEVWVAGIKTASQTPAIRSGQRIIFVTIDDTTGPIEVTVFERVQPWCARTVFHSWLLLVRGFVRKRGGATRTQTKMDLRNVGLTIVAEEAFDLAVAAEDLDKGMSVEAALARQRKIARASVTPVETKPVPKLWHASGGSAGR
jgi:error-prone DNA polymerase